MLKKMPRQDRRQEDNKNGNKHVPKNGKTPSRVSQLPKINNQTDTRDILAHAAKERADDYFIVDVDAHVTETAFWSEVVDRMESDVYKQMARAFKERGTAAGLLNAAPGMLYQDVFGRIPHQQRLGEAVPGGSTHAQVTLVQRAMDSMGIDYMVVFPTPMLVLGMHPQIEMEVVIGNAFNKWLTEEILPQDPRIKAMLYLPFNHPEACVKTVETYANTPGVIGYSVTSTRFRAVNHDSYMPLYAAIQATGKPLAFHSGFHWGDQSMQQCNRFISMHAISFVYYNLIHLTNWIINGLPERFPKLRVLWIESGLAWVPFLMQRLDSEYMMRSSEAPLLKRRPSEYIADMFFTSQPLERSNMKLTEATFDVIKAETQLLFASDWPHWDFDLPSSITSLPFLDEQAKRNILGLNAARLFNLEVPKDKLIKPKGKKAPASREPVTA
ncbi:MAG TPA: amidohydrolase family protein [Xanthobacteraceae bacterium]|nr:amidohydrolase family protein [Xanthobacteraceae bacterium]